MQTKWNRLLLNTTLVCSVFNIAITEAKLDCYKQLNLDGSSIEVCLGRIPICKAGDKVVMDLSVDENLEAVNSNDSSKLDFDVHVEQDWVVQVPDQGGRRYGMMKDELMWIFVITTLMAVVTYGGKGSGNLTLQGTGRVGKALISLHCVAEKNDTVNTSCQLSEETLHLLQREASFVHFLELNIVIEVVGWIYCIIWIIGFYPQIILNLQRRSVVGLNFDFVAFNLTGGLAYAMFNIGFFWIPQVKNEYFLRHPAGVYPVLLNDVIFSVNAAIAQTITVIQCFVFKREKQRLSYPGVVFLIVLWLVMIVPIGVSAAGLLSWLNYLYIISYVKLGVTPIKYIPQIVLNFKRKSTEGLSAGNVLLELIGGAFSVLQMLLLAYNFDDWKSIYGDPTKFGLGIIAMLFDLMILFQHFVLYRGAQMREHKLHSECKCSSDVTMHYKCAMERNRRLSNVIAMPDLDISLLKPPKTFQSV